MTPQNLEFILKQNSSLSLDGLGALIVKNSSQLVNLPFVKQTMNIIAFLENEKEAIMQEYKTQGILLNNLKKRLARRQLLLKEKLRRYKNYADFMEHIRISEEIEKEKPTQGKEEKSGFDKLINKFQELYFYYLYQQALLNEWHEEFRQETKSKLTDYLINHNVEPHDEKQLDNILDATKEWLNKPIPTASQLSQLGVALAPIPKPRQTIMSEEQEQQLIKELLSTRDTLSFEIRMAKAFKDNFRNSNGSSINNKQAANLVKIIVLNGVPAKGKFQETISELNEFQKLINNDEDFKLLTHLKNNFPAGATLNNYSLFPALKPSNSNKEEEELRTQSSHKLPKCIPPGIIETNKG
ncbi:MAG: hypothetical protein LEGION0398_MBIBDBAK_00599 [Legionellaceae bacterium]